MTHMADLHTGTRIRHGGWKSTGTVKVSEDITVVHWDGSFVADEISPAGVVFPEDVEIIGEASDG